MRYDLITMDVFTAVAEERNLTRAAERLHLAVSAVSKRIAELEEQVGSPLLLRYARGVELTPAGQSVLHYARELRLVLGQMDEELASYSAGVKGHIRIHAITSALTQFLPGDLERFIDSYPQINFDIEERVGSAVVRAVIEGRADIGIFAEHTRNTSLETRPYRQDQLVVVIPREHALAGHSKVSFRQALEHEFIGPHLESSLYTLFTQQQAEVGINMRVRVRVSSFECMCRLVAASVGIAILPKTAIMQYLKPMKLQMVPLDESWARRMLVIGVRSTDLLTPTVRTLFEHLAAKG
ncbi:LysR family transcriptional regulator [Ectopseudomonas khazarica]|uniref:LysR family transcriptional regulator n=1 Tax=Ectopseudomonas khazarica TaxID=2502979 RepID=UPI00106DFC30|nr:LysR family transcriptional regulator [Pseudomonas khazarica]